MANNGAETKWSVLASTVKTLQFLINGWGLASLLRGPAIRRLSFNDRIGLQGCIEDDLDDPQPSDENSSKRVYQRSTSYVSASSSDDDVDRRAEIFISNFYRQLQLERQISLELRYCRPSSSSSSSAT